MAIVSILELGDSLPDLFEVAEDAPMNRLLLQRTVEAFGDTVGLWFGNKGETRSDAPEPDLVNITVSIMLAYVLTSATWTLSEAENQVEAELVTNRGDRV